MLTFVLSTAKWEKQDFNDGGPVKTGNTGYIRFLTRKKHPLLKYLWYTYSQNVLFNIGHFEEFVFSKNKVKLIKIG